MIAFFLWNQRGTRCKSVKQFYLWNANSNFTTENVILFPAFDCTIQFSLDLFKPQLNGCNLRRRNCQGLIAANSSVPMCAKQSKTSIIINNFPPKLCLRLLHDNNRIQWGFDACGSVVCMCVFVYKYVQQWGGIPVAKEHNSIRARATACCIFAIECSVKIQRE